MPNAHQEATPSITMAHPHHDSKPSQATSALLIGASAPALIWLLSGNMDPTVQKALSIVAFMTAFWILEPIDHAVTALIGCYLFWAFNVVEFPIAFSGFANSAPWFLLGALLMGEAASQSGLAKRLGFLVLRRVSTTYSALLFGVIILSFLLNFFVPSGMARLAVMAPIVMGIVAAFDLDRQSNIAKAFFIILTYSCGLFDRMIMSGAASILTRGIIEEKTGIQIFWSQWLLAYLPALVVTLFACWVTVRWLYSPEKTELPRGKSYILDALREMGA